MPIVSFVVQIVLKNMKVTGTYVSSKIVLKIFGDFLFYMSLNDDRSGFYD